MVQRSLSQGIIKRNPWGETNWKPPRNVGLAVGFATTALAVALEAALLVFLFGRPIDLGSFFVGLLAVLAGCLIAVLIYYVYGLLSLSYIIDPQSLTVDWGTLRHVIPLSSIVEVLVDVEIPLGVNFSGLNLPGCVVGRAYFDEIGQVQVYATSTLPEQMVLVTTSATAYAVSPLERVGFVNELNHRLGAVVADDLPVRVAVPRLATLSFWQDRAGLLLVLAALLGNAAIYAYVSFKYPALPPLLPLHYNAFGEIDFIGARAEAFKIPAIGTVVTIVNLVATLGLHSRERLATQLLLVTAILVQVILLVATVKIIY